MSEWQLAKAIRHLIRLQYCERCDGKGWITISTAGVIERDECPACHGAGQRELTELYDSLEKFLPPEERRK